MAADNSRMLARRIEETFDGEDTSPRGGSQPSQYEERVWFSQFQDPDQVFRHILTYRIGGESDLLRLTSALETVCAAWPELRVRFSFGEDGTLAKSVEAPSASLVQLFQAPSTDEAIALLHDLQASPYDAEIDPPFQAIVLLSEGEVLLALLVHGLLGETLSSQTLLEAIAAAYAGEAPKPLLPRIAETGIVNPLPLPWLQGSASGTHVISLRDSGAKPASHSHGVDLPATLLDLDGSTTTEALLARAGARFAHFIATNGNLDTVTLRLPLQSGGETGLPLPADAVARVSIPRGQSLPEAEKAVLAGLKRQIGNSSKHNDEAATFTLQALATSAETSSVERLRFERLPLPSLQSGLGLTLAAGSTVDGHIRLELTGGKETSPHGTAFLLERFVTHLEGGADFSA
ncbi:MAG: agrobactine synthetase subunit F, partial [Rhizobium oryzihabitans]